MLDTFLYWLFIFFLFNVMGWVLESTIESISNKRLINRGFLAGPYIPIYGVGGILFAVVGKALKSESSNIFINIFLVFFVGMSLATLLEYMIGSILERVFKKQFWDYSMLKLTYKFTYKNRISLVSSIFWGFCSLFMTYFLYEKVDMVMHTLHSNLIIIFNIVMTVIMGTDAVIQIKRQENVQKILEKLSREQLKEALLKTLLRMGSARQIRDFRDAMFKNIQKNIQSINENINENIQKIRIGISGTKESEKQEAEEEE